MATTLNEKLQALSPQRRKAIEAHASELILEERTLQASRKELFRVLCLLVIPPR